MPFEPIWVDIVFPKGMKSLSSGRDSNYYAESDSEDGGGEEMVAMARSSAKGGSADNEVFSTSEKPLSQLLHGSPAWLVPTPVCSRPRGLLAVFNHIHTIAGFIVLHYIHIGTN